MKRLLVLLPLLLVGCTNDKISDNSHIYSRQDVVYNVYYTYDFSSKHYLVVIEDKEYRVSPKNYYNIKIDEWSYTEEHRLIYNEFYSSSLELFVYYRQ